MALKVLWSSLDKFKAPVVLFCIFVRLTLLLHY